jgi:hypothetical protein
MEYDPATLAKHRTNDEFAALRMQVHNEMFGQPRPDGVTTMTHDSAPVDADPATHFARFKAEVDRRWEQFKRSGDNCGTCTEVRRIVTVAGDWVTNIRNHHEGNQS